MAIFLLASDSFKESMSAKEACLSMKKGIQNADPKAKCIVVPMADGGEGTVEALIAGDFSSKKVFVTVTGPLPEQKISSYYGLIDNGQTAVIEMALASGLQWVPIEQRNPLNTTTYGVGELLNSALNQGVSKIIIGLGGSATNDGGAGMAQGLGVQFLDKNKQVLDLRTGGNLKEIAFIDQSRINPRLKEVKVIIASDVTNPLLGPKGATNVFARQKGANEDMLAVLESNLAHYEKVIQSELQLSVATISGAGAAGGLGAGLVAFAFATIEKGIELIIKQTKLETKIQQADYVFTGEGAVDFQTKFGKTPYGIARLAKQYQKPVIICAGIVGEQLEELYTAGVTSVFSIIQKNDKVETLLKQGAGNLERTCENIVRLLMLNSNY